MPSRAIVSVKIPRELLDKIPRPGNGRSGFIVEAIREKVARRTPPKWLPRTERGRRMAAILAKGQAERMPLLSDREIERELAERRGRSF